jgi:hypothetical protein
MSDDLGPPENDDGRPPPGRPAHAEQVVATTNSTPATIKTGSCRLDSSGVPRQCRPETWMWRRRQAAQRLAPLGCGCRDPLFCRCRPPVSERPALSEKMVDAGADAAIHILITTGCAPILKTDVLRALWRRGGDDRRLAQEPYELAGGDAA